MKQMNTKQMAKIIDANRKEQKNTKVRVVKISDRTKVPHPNIQPGAERIGLTDSPPKMGRLFSMLHTNNTKMFLTSPVIQVNDDCTFETMNSIYKLEIVK